MAYLLPVIFGSLNYSNVREAIRPFDNDLILIFTILGGLSTVIIIWNYFTRIPKYIWNKLITPTDSRALVEYDKYFTEDELEKFNRKYVDRIEEKGRHDVIEELRQFLKSSYQVLIIAGESGIGKTRLAIEASKGINSGFKFWNKCLFINLRHYKNPADIKDKLNRELSKYITVIFDDYQYNLDVFNEVKSIAFKRDSKIIITTRPIFVGSLKEKIGQAAIKPLFLGRMDVKDILSNIKDKHLRERIIRISEGIPSIALLALDYVEDAAKQGGKSFFQGITSKGEFFSKIIKDFEKETSGDFIKFLAGGALIGGFKKIPKEYEEYNRLFVNSGHIIRTGNLYRLTPDILSDYLIYYVFFDGNTLASYFTEMAAYNNGEHVLEILNSVVKLNDDSEIYREAVQILFKSVDVSQKKKRIKAGISAYEGFGGIRLITDNLGEFWKDYRELDDANDLLSLGEFLLKISKFDEAKVCWEDAEKLFNKANDKGGIAGTLNNIASIHYIKGEYDKALEKYDQSVKIKTELGDRKGIAGTLNNIALIHQIKGDYDKALEKYEQAMKIMTELEDRKGISSTLHNIAIIHQNKGDYDKALEKNYQSLKIMTELGDRKGIAGTLNNIAIIHDNKGDYDKAMQRYDQSLKIKIELGDRSGIATTLNNIGEVHRMKGEYDKALEKYEQAMKIMTDLGDRKGIAGTLHNIAIIHQNKGDYDKAMQRYDQSLKIKIELGDRSGIATTLNNTGIIHQVKGDYDKALEKYTKALKIRIELGDRNGIATTLHNIAIIHQVKGDYDKALEKYEQALKIRIELSDRSGIATTLSNIAIIHQIKGEYDNAMEKYEQAMRIRTELGDRSGIAMTNAQLGVFHRDRSDLYKSLTHFISANKIFSEIGNRPNYTNTLRDIAATIDLIDMRKITDKSILLPVLQEARNLFAKEKDEANTAKLDGLIAEIKAEGDKNNK